MIFVDFDVVFTPIQVRNTSENGKTSKSMCINPRKSEKAHRKSRKSENRCEFDREDLKRHIGNQENPKIDVNLTARI